MDGGQKSEFSKNKNNSSVSYVTTGSKRYSRFENFKNIYLKYIYLNHSDTLFKILFDRLFRIDVYNTISKMNVIKLERKNAELKILFSENIFFPNTILVNEIIEKEGQENMKDELNYVVLNLRFIKLSIMSLILFTISSSLLCIHLCGELKIIKRIRYAKSFKYIQPLCFIFLMNFILLQTYLLLSINKLNKKTQVELETKYSRLIEKYNLIYGNKKV